MTNVSGRTIRPYLEESRSPNPSEAGVSADKGVGVILSRPRSLVTSGLAIDKPIRKTCGNKVCHKNYRLVSPVRA